MCNFKPLAAGGERRKPSAGEGVSMVMIGVIFLTRYSLYPMEWIRAW